MADFFWCSPTWQDTRGFRENPRDFGVPYLKQTQITLKIQLSRHHQIKIVTITKGQVGAKLQHWEPPPLSSTLGATSLPFLCSTTLRGVGYGMTKKLASKLQFLHKGASGNPEIPWKKWWIITISIIWQKSSSSYSSLPGAHGTLGWLTAPVEAPLVQSLEGFCPQKLTPSICGGG